MSRRTGRECLQLASARQALVPIARRDGEAVPILRRARDRLVNRRSYGPIVRVVVRLSLLSQVRVRSARFPPVPKCEACASLRGSVSLSSRPIQKIVNGGRDLLMVSFKREVAGVVQMDFRICVVSPESLGSSLQEKRIVLAPNSK